MLWYFVVSLVLPVILAQSLEQFRPVVHYSPKQNWMNDPNGLVYYDGEWHLFYQHYPREAKAKNIHWGHAVSQDLIRWTELPIALTPEDETVGIWSGSAVIDWKNVTGFQREETVHPMIAIYTWQKRGWQEQHMSYSLDKGKHEDRLNLALPIFIFLLSACRSLGRTWTKYSSNPIMPLNVNVSFPTDTDLDASAVVFRDPKLMYHAASGAWIAVISGGDHMQFHRSTDLIHWSLVSRFGYTHGSHAGIWECPDLFEFSMINRENQTQLWVLIVSIDRNAVAGGSGMQYFIGTFDGYTFGNLQPPQNINWLDYGPDFYAGITYYNVPRYDNRRVMIAWMNNWQYAQDVPTGPLWRGQMAIPRQLELEYNPFQSAYQLRQSPVYELYSHSNKLLTFQGQSLNSCSSNVLSDVSAQSFMLSTEFHRVTGRTAIHFRLRQNSEGTEYTLVSYIGETNRIELDRSRSGNVNFHPLFRTHYNMTLDDQTITTGVLQLQIIVDRCSVEVFVNRGKSSMTALIFPQPSSDRMELAMEGDGEVQMDYLEVMLL